MNRETLWQTNKNKLRNNLKKICLTFRHNCFITKWRWLSAFSEYMKDRSLVVYWLDESQINEALETDGAVHFKA